MNQEFLTLLKDARKNEKSQIVDLDYTQLYHLSKEHEVLALIYNQIYAFPSFPTDLKNQWKREAIKINAIQTIKTDRFLKVYQKFIEADIIVLVVKGIICRSLYPQPENRPSNDEDLYVQQKDFDKAKNILLDNDFVLVEEGEDVSTFLDRINGLSIELHTSLFSQESKAYGKFQDSFEHAFDSPIQHCIYNVNVYSLSHDLHFLFLLMHLIKHFLHGGVGIRQILDIVMYGEQYGQFINWDYIYTVLKDSNFYVFIMNVFALAHDLLDMSFEHIQLLDDYETINKDYQSLLDDILDAGVFGKSSQERLHSSTMTLNAMETGKKSLKKSLFPEKSYLEKKYTYLKKYPFLLPIAWISRIISYIGNKQQGSGQKTIEIGNQRIELLKKYKIIK